MSTVFLSSLVIWLLLVASVLVLALFRMALTHGKYTVLHVRRSELSLIPEQVLDEHRLNRIDFWGQVLTLIAFTLGLLLVVIYAYAVIAGAPD